MQTLESMRRRIESAEDLHAVVRVMKALAAVSILQYEKAVESLAEYSRTLEKGLQVVLRNRPEEFAGEEARPGSRWRVTLRHDGEVVTSKVHTADAEGDIDIDRWRRNTAGTDTFKLTVKPVGGTACSAKITLR